MKKLSVRWMLHLLTVDHKRDCVTISKQCLRMFQRNPDEFLRRFITVDEIWIHYFTSKTKEQSKQWTSLGEPAPRKAKTIKSAGRWWSFQFFGMRYNSYRLSSERSMAITTQSYWTTSTIFSRKNIPIWRRRKCSSIKTMQRFIHARYRWLNSTIPLRIASLSSIFARFSSLRLFPVSWRNGSEKDSQRAAHRRNRGLFWRVDKLYYLDGLKKLENLWIKCIKLKGDYMLRNKNESIKKKMCFTMFF